MTAGQSTDYCLGSYCSIYLFTSLCSPLQSPRLEKHFGVTFVLIHVLSEVSSRVGHGLVRVVCAMPGLSLQSPGQEKHFDILFIPLWVIVREDTVVCTDMPKEIMANLAAWFSALFIVFCSIFWVSSFHSSVTEEHFDTFCDFWLYWKKERK